MDAMHAALKVKRQKFGMLDSGDGETPVNPDSGGGSGMAELVAKLSPDQIEELKSLLMSNEGEGETSAADIGKGNPSREEKSKIQARMAEDQSQEGEDADEWEDASMSLLDKRHMEAPDDYKPKGLGDKARFSAAKRMKEKGKA